MLDRSCISTTPIAMKKTARVLIHLIILAVLKCEYDCQMGEKSKINVFRSSLIM